MKRRQQNGTDHHRYSLYHAHNAHSSTSHHSLISTVQSAFSTVNRYVQMIPGVPVWSAESGKRTTTSERGLEHKEERACTGNGSKVEMINCHLLWKRTLLPTTLVRAQGWALPRSPSPLRLLFWNNHLRERAGEDHPLPKQSKLETLRPRAWLRRIPVSCSDISPNDSLSSKA